MDEISANGFASTCRSNIYTNNFMLNRFKVDADEINVRKSNAVENPLFVFPNQVVNKKIKVLSIKHDNKSFSEDKTSSPKNGGFNVEKTLPRTLLPFPIMNLKQNSQSSSISSEYAPPTRNIQKDVTEHSNIDQSAYDLGDLGSLKRALISENFESKPKNSETNNGLSIKSNTLKNDGSQIAKRAVTEKENIDQTCHKLNGVLPEINEEQSKPGNKICLEDLRLFKTLGTGTFGRVLLAESKDSPHSLYAIKALLIRDIIRLNQVEHSNNERKILLSIKHPFIVKCYDAFADRKCLYLMMEYVPGGELFSYLQKMERFSEKATLFYITEIICVLEYLHLENIVYRDLKPENLLLDAKGHIKLTDFGFAKYLNDTTWTLCGTPEYLSPEVIQGKGHDFACDWWALGILCYEMLVGEAPFVDDHPFGLYEKILDCNITWPDDLNNTVSKDFISKLIVVDRSTRLGKGKNGSEAVKGHCWFNRVNWNHVLHQKYRPPFQPVLLHERDTSNFDEFDEEWNLDKVSNSSEKEKTQFIDWYT